MRARIAKKFRIAGLSITPKGLNSLQAALQQSTDPQKGIKAVIRQIEYKNIHTSVVNETIIEECIQALSNAREGNKTPEDDVVVIGAFDSKGQVFDSARGAYKSVTTRSILGAAADNVNMYRSRLSVHQIRLQRHPRYQKQLRTINSLVGSKESALVMGFLSQLRENEFWLEDCDGRIPVNIEHATYGSGLVTENCVVLAQGKLDPQDNVFHVSRLSLPPSPEALDTTPISASTDTDMGSLVFLSDVWLDKPEVIAKLRLLFRGMHDSGMKLSGFVFMGSFTSIPIGSNTAILTQGFQELAKIILQFPSMRLLKYIFVPGPSDPVPAVLPSPPIPGVFTSSITSKLPNAVFTTNPCRLERNTVMQTQDLQSAELHDRVVQTVIHSGHLAPTNKSILWNYDHALWLDPTPNTLVLGDRYEAYNTLSSGCTCFNPGPFPIESSFMLLDQHNQTEYSQVI